ncbi:uncharacterized protein F5Z01DRAFT_3861 [Emericellopsis atlantica]|uniref:DUF7082 domain-containing protein n=1 Tax=Emericellopsis atlantica TaxID=2614577 RepID=A0A9P7ZUX7_9HYPO|nr:uncharacterized protein F5Z01DRAFT_3861 [Emericellopsis atlantica]KAG9258788.1 hypothetical protein F5Z01DRAFT_3861 [Emericellopsis atlantica]
MSSVKFQSPSYKLFEPEYHPQRPIIVGLDDTLESPDTIALRLEEARRGSLGEDSSPRLFEMATYSKAAPLPSMNGYDPMRFHQNTYEQYQPEPYPAPAQNDKFAQLNQQAFASNNAVAPPVSPYMPPGPSVVSCHPTTGTEGTRVFLKISSHYDIYSISATPYFHLQFGNEKCALRDVTNHPQSSNGSYIYSCSAEAPQSVVTGCDSSNVPLSLVIEAAPGEEISRTAAGSFQYVQGPEDDITRTDKLPKLDHAPHAPTADDHESVSPKMDQPPAISSVVPTNNYDAPPEQPQYSSEPYAQTPEDMISTYRSSTYVESPYNRRSAHGWTNFPGTLGSSGRSPMLSHHQSMTGRPSLAPLTSGSGQPELIRTSTINPNSTGNSYSQMTPSTPKAVLKINGNLNSMAENWTPEEWGNRRRIVMFRRKQVGNTLNTTFQPVPVNERPQNSICISCIYWAEKKECFVTSVDTIYLLEQLLTGPKKFSVEEKNRIRRNLEGYAPHTVSKGKAESQEFFKLIMAFGNPKPRNIEKDVKVFNWKNLEASLKKIIGKYSARPAGGASQMPSNMMAHTPYATLPTPPGQALSHHRDHQQQQPQQQHSQYPMHSSHHDIPSPRSLSGSGPSWAPYTAAPSYQPPLTRTLSPHLRQPSPQQPPHIRINTSNTLPSVSTYDSRSITASGYGATGLHTPISQHPSNATPPRWDPAPVNYADGYSGMGQSHLQHPHHSQNHNHNHTHHAQQTVYGTGPPAYGDGGPPRA